MNRVNKLLLAGLAVLALSAACTKKRDDRFYQGQGLELMTYGELNGKTFSLQTGEIISDATKTASEKITIEGSVEGIRNLPLVRYKTNADLLGEDLPFRGRPNTRYEVRYRIQDRFLRVEKIAPEELIPNDEMTYAVKEPDGRYAVPMVGYKVSYYRIEKQLNSDNEATNLIIEVPERTPSKASHVRVDHLNRQLFSALDKIDVYPAKYFFDHEWYFSETVVSTAEDQTTTMVGGTASVYDASFNPASKIKFMKEKDQLRGVNVNIDERLKDIYKDDRLNYKTVISIPLEWKSYRIAIDGNGDALKEEDNDDIRWDQRDYMGLKFEETRTVIESLQSYLVRLTGGKKLIDLKFAQDYFSYALLDIDSGKIVRYSFLKAPKLEDIPENRRFVERTYPRITRKDFGFFTSSWNEIYNYEMYRLADIEEHTYLNRFNPKKDEIVFYMTNSSADDELLERVSERAANYWDKTFELAGATTRIRFDNKKRVDLGDLRYNAIHYIDGLSSESGLLGYGPSLSDPKTGEIIMATSNMHVTNFRSSIVSQLRLYIRQQLGFYEAAISHTPDVMFNYMGDFEGTPARIFNPANYQFYKDPNGIVKEVTFPINNYISRDANTLLEIPVNYFSPDSVYSKLVTYIDKGAPPTSAYELAQRYNRILRERPDLAHFASHADIDSFKTIMSDTIDERCPELKVYAAQVQADSQLFNTEDELKAMAPCLEKFLEEKLLATLVHEMGHNFGLAHNFKGSIDKDNFWTEAELKEFFNIEVPEGKAPRSASTMDYIPLEHDRLVTPGKYDIAAINFGYVDDRNVKPKVKIVSKPMYCDDRDESLGFDPFCRKHDFGTTAVEIATNYIKSIQQNLTVYRYRFDRASAPNAAASNRSHMDNLKRLYDHWRFRLKDFAGSKAGYLQGWYDPRNEASAKAYQTDLLAKMHANSSFKDEFEEFFPVRNLTYGFLKNIALMPDALCTYRDVNDNLQWIPLITARDEIKAKHGRDNMVMSCNDDMVSKLIATDYGGEYVSQLGQPADDYQFSLNIIDLRYIGMDVVGVTSERLYAARLLGIRSLGTLAHIDSNVQPNMLDEPDLRWDMTKSVLNRLVFGTDIGESVNGSQMVQDMMGDDYLKFWELIRTQKNTGDLVPEGVNEGSVIAEAYSNDWTVTRLLYDYLYVSGSVPGSSSETTKRRDAYRSIPLRVASEIGSDIVDYVAIESKDEITGNFSYVGARERNVFTRYLINELKSTQFRAQNMQQILEERDLIMGSLQNILAAIPPTSADGKSGGVTTVEEFKTFVNAINAEINGATPNGLLAKLMTNMFSLELTTYKDVISKLDDDVAKLRQNLAKLEAMIAQGVDENGVAITAERKALLENDANSMRTAIGIRDSGIAIKNYAELMNFVDSRLMSGNLPPRQVLRREPIQRRFDESLKKGSPLELDAKVTLLTEALTTSIRVQ